MLAKYLSKIVARILNAAIRTDNQASFRSATLNCPMQCSLDHLTTQRTAQCPTNDHSQKQIQKDSQVQPTPFSSDVGNIRNPHLFGALAKKSRCRKFAATGYVCFESVVGKYLRRTINLIPIAFIQRATRFLLT